MDLTDGQRRVLAQAKKLERQRIEIYAQAVEASCADLLPESFSDFDAQMEDPVEVTMTLALTEKDAERLTDRDCRNLVRFFGEQCDHERAHRAFAEEEDD